MQVDESGEPLGSSPLTRGKRGCGGSELLCFWLIPAHAGKTRRGYRPSRGCRAHPRARRENVSQPVHPCGDAGSSPLTRGKPRGEGAPCVPEGLIPTHAGKTRRASRSRTYRRAHPHSRGENEMPSICPNRTWGSSPLMRGKPARGGRAQETRGLIPAHAGKTLSPLARLPPPTAHPRSRGENISPIECMSSRMGSSPLRRGKPESSSSPVGALGLIPTHAGKTNVLGK